MSAKKRVRIPAGVPSMLPGGTKPVFPPKADLRTDPAEVKRQMDQDLGEFAENRPNEAKTVLPRARAAMRHSPAWMKDVLTPVPTVELLLLASTLPAGHSALKYIHKQPHAVVDTARDYIVSQRERAEWAATASKEQIDKLKADQKLVLEQRNTAEARALAAEEGLNAARREVESLKRERNELVAARNRAQATAASLLWAIEQAAKAAG